MRRGLLLVALGVAFVGGQLALAQDVEKDRVQIKVKLPQADAKLLFEDQPTRQTGVTRTFTSPPIGADGTYHYTVKAVWEPNNYTTITRTRVIDVTPGKAFELDLTGPEDPRLKDDIVVRYVPTPNEVVDLMCTMAKVGPNDVVYDLGCGDGRMVIIAVEKFGAKKGVGVDLDQKRVEESEANAKKSTVENKLEFRKGDVLKIDDLPNATVVLLYMGHDINKRLEPVLKARLKPGSRVVSHRFLMNDDWPPMETRHLTVGKNNYDVHLWVIGEEKK